MLFAPTHKCRMCGEENSCEALEIKTEDGIIDALDIYYQQRIRHQCSDGNIGVCKFMGLRKAELSSNSNEFDKSSDL